MGASTLARSLPASALRRWRSLRLRTKAALALLAIALPVAGWFFLRGPVDDWPARAVLKTPRDTWPLAFSPDGKTFLTSGEGGITPWEVATGRKGDLWAIKDDRFAVTGAFSPDGRTFAVAVASQPKALSIELIDTATGQTRTTLATDSPSVYAVRFADDGRTLRGFLGDGPDLKEVVTWDAETGREISSRPLSAPTKGGIAAISADGRTLAISPMRAFAVQLWDLDADQSLGTVMNPKATSVVSWGGVGLSSDGRTLAVAREDGTIELWDVPTRRLRATLTGQPKGFDFSGLRVSPDGRTLAADGHPSRRTSTLGQIREGILHSLGGQGQRRDNAEVIVLDVATGKLLARAPTSMHPFYSPDGRTIATRQEDLSVRLRDLPDRPR